MSFSALITNRRWGVAILAAVIVLGILLVRPWHGRARAVAADASGAPVVAVARVAREDLFREITFPAEFRPYAEVELHAKVSGYVKEMKVDIGDRVMAGELLAVLDVTDNGIGIPAEALPHVFKRFFRVDGSRSREQGGAGLGLSIVKSICSAHGAVIEVMSAPGRGSTFRIRQPLAGDAAARAS